MIDLFTPVVEKEKQHFIFKTLSHSALYAERKVILDWAKGFIDRDKKFIKEFQTTFESSFWELYINKILKVENVEIDFSHHAPDFVCSKNNISFSIEATIANPEKDGLPSFGVTDQHLDLDINFADFNRKSIIRIANSIITKTNKFKNSYKKLSHVNGKPFILGLNSFDRPHAHLIGHRGLIAVLYGIYLNEEKSRAENLNYIPHEKMDFIEKENGATIPLGFFTSSEYEDISAIIYNPYATWGKVRALSEVSDANKLIFFNVLYSKEKSVESDLIPEIKSIVPKEEYTESIFDGLYIFHNPYAKYPIPEFLFKDPRIAHYSIDKSGRLTEEIEGKFMLSRTILSLDTFTLPK
ncbi:hypothetical protein ACQP6V_18150 [Acinetobacter baumannii]|uniref:hypothetical protein n=1 Tax=Acinetobacter baumannii TaxID=470 RepID=UPI003D03980D